MPKDKGGFGNGVKSAKPYDKNDAAPKVRSKLKLPEPLPLTSELHEMDLAVGDNTKHKDGGGSFAELAMINKDGQHQRPGFRFFDRNCGSCLRMTFAPSKYKDEDTKLSFVIDISKEHAEEILAFEAKVQEELVKSFDTAWPSMAKMHKTEAERKVAVKTMWKSKVRMPDPEDPDQANWSPTLRLTFKEDTPPTVELRKLKWLDTPDGKVPALTHPPKPGTVEDMQDKCAVIHEVQLSGGIWMVSNQCGLRWDPANWVIVLKNMSEAPTKSVVLTNTCPDSDDEEAAPKAPVLALTGEYVE